MHQFKNNKTSVCTSDSVGYYGLDWDGLDWIYIKMDPNPKPNSVTEPGVWRWGVHENPDLPEAFHKRRMHEFANLD